MSAPTPCAICRKEHDPSAHCLVPVIERLLAQVGHESHKFGGDVDRAVDAACTWIAREMDDRTTFMTENMRLRGLLSQTAHDIGEEGYSKWSSDLHRAISGALDDKEADRG